MVRPLGPVHRSSVDLAGPFFEISPYPEILFDVFICEGGLKRAVNICHMNTSSRLLG